MAEVERIWASRKLGAESSSTRAALIEAAYALMHEEGYAAVTSRAQSTDPAHDFDRTTHYLLDSRLMMTWAQALATQGRLDEARYLSARLKEFGKEDAEDFFDACLDAPAASGAAASAPPFQCSPPAQPHSWRSYVPR